MITEGTVLKRVERLIRAASLPWCVSCRARMRTNGRYVYCAQCLNDKPDVDSRMGRPCLDIDIDRVATLRRLGRSVESIAGEMGVHRNTIHRHLSSPPRTLKQETPPPVPTLDDYEAVRKVVAYITFQLRRVKRKHVWQDIQDQILGSTSSGK